MKRFKYPLRVALCVCLGVAVLFALEQRVERLEQQHSYLQAEFATNANKLRTLKAEWSYLASPSRLAKLNEKHLGMLPIEPTQLMRLEQLAKRLEPSGVKAGGTEPRSVGVNEPHSFKANGIEARRGEPSGIKLRPLETRTLETNQLETRPLETRPFELRTGKTHIGKTHHKATSNKANVKVEVIQ